MKNNGNLTLEELDRRITHFEDRLRDFIITEEQMGFIKEMLRELKNAKEIKESYTFLNKIYKFKLKRLFEYRCFFCNLFLLY